VDDADELRTFLRSLLEEKGYQVEEAASGNEAVELCDSREYDLVLMDIILPDLNGIEACRKILSAHPERQPPKIVMLTAHAEHGLILESLMAGAQGYILKPVTAELFFESVESFLQNEKPDQGE
jgi:CheY-like chemotaxis protein